MSKKSLAMIVLISSSLFVIFFAPTISRTEFIIVNLLMSTFSKVGLNWLTSYLYANIIEALSVTILLIPIVLWCRKWLLFLNSGEVETLSVQKILIRYSLIGFLFCMALLIFALFTQGIFTLLIS